ncbi:MAG TPA: hypothetical protein VGP89_17290 [Candidatus Angelobacter sp.]|nr:hypothetical protein [Candidatus Angelobacter sp.]
MSEKNRSAGITVVAVLAMIGSALFLLMAVLIAVIMVVAPTPTPNDFPLPPQLFKAFKVMLPLFYAAPATWGILTAFGLLRLKNWARISTIVFSFLLILFGACGMLGAVSFFLIPPAANGLDPKGVLFIGLTMAVFSVCQIGIGIWWLVFFNRANIKAQFVTMPLLVAAEREGLLYPTNLPYSTSAPPPGPPIALSKPTGRPLSISIIAWYLLAVCIVIPFSLALHAPTVLFTAILTGWRSAMFFVVLGGLHIYTGTALLRMKPAGRLIGIGYFVFNFLNIAVFYFAPGSRARIARFLDSQQSMFPWMASSKAASPFQHDLIPLLVAGAVVGLALSLVPVYFLAAAKPAFDQAARRQVE